MNQPNLKLPPDPPVTLLLIEPDVLARLVLADYLRGCGYIVVEVSSADEAIEALRSTTEIELVLSEIHDIGSMSGFEFAHSVRMTHPNIDVILTSNQTHAAQKCHELCEHRVVRKPYTPQEIVRQIHMLRQNRRSRRKQE
jgi:CheY-like chemotaxis protein